MKTLFAKNKGWRNVFVITLLNLIFSIADIITTYIYTPDLSNEANMLVQLLGFDWARLIIVKIIELIIILLFAYHSFVYYKRPVIQCIGFNEYISMLLFDRADKFYWFFIKRPKRKGVGLASAGYALSVMSIVASVFAVVNNIFCIIKFRFCLLCFFNIRHTYCNLIHIHTSNGVIYIPIVLLVILVPMALAVYFSWFYKEYKINQKSFKLKNEMQSVS